MKIVLVRHAAVETEPAVVPALWQLSDEGRAGARALARERLWWPIERIFTSPEAKALETAHIIAGPNGMTVTAVEDLHEVERPANQWFDDRYPGGYAGAVRDYLAAPERATHGWEPPAEAQHRIRTCIDWLRRWEPHGFAVAGHGQTLSLYVASVIGLDPWEVWRTINLPDYAVIDPGAGRLIRGFGQPWGSV
ncbi:MAG: histidine phosphatase family protein [Dehalococcoidia bacterium]